MKAWITVIWLLAGCASALAQSCSFDISALDFSDVDLTTGAAVDTTATLKIVCGSGVGTVRVCPSIGAGSGGATSGARQMSNGLGTLNYQIYQDVNRSVVWGSYTWAYAARPPTIDVTLSLTASVTRNVTLYGRILANQSGASAGSYQSTFGAGDVDIAYGLLGTILPCPNIVVLPQHANPTFTARAGVLGTCTLVADDIDFGVRGTLGAAIDVTGRVTLTCSSGVSYAVSLGTSSSLTNDPTTRRMTIGNSGTGAAVTYGLYRDTARQQPWGSNAGVDTVAGSGSGAPTSLTVYARVPAQATPAAATYRDSVLVTITY